MGRNNIEKEFRAKLESREIQPSPQAWDRLDAMLTVSESAVEKPLRRIGWIYYAAASVVILLMTALFFTMRNDREQPTQVVDAPSGVPANHRELQDSQFNTVPDAPISVGTKLAPKPRTTVAGIDLGEKKKAGPQISGQPENHAGPIHTEPQTDIAVISPNNPQQGIEQLLASAGNQTVLADDKVKVDPRSLLSQVDGELELTFREEVIRTVRKNYKNVKVALANRNQE